MNESDAERIPCGSPQGKQAQTKNLSPADRGLPAGSGGELQCIRIGQRWISRMEPELGLGIVNAADRRTVRIRFNAGGCERQYALSSAPILRVRFKPGDTVRSRSGTAFSVEKITDLDGILTYTGEGRQASRIFAIR